MGGQGAKGREEVGGGGRGKGISHRRARAEQDQSLASAAPHQPGLTAGMSVVGPLGDLSSGGVSKDKPCLSHLETSTVPTVLGFPGIHFPS